MLWVVLLTVFSLLFGVWGYLAARSRGRTPIVWALVCAFTFFIGIAIVYSLGDPLLQDSAPSQQAFDQDADGLSDSQAHQSPAQRNSRRSQLPAVVQRPMTLAPVESADDRRWRYLTEYHPRIGEAVQRIQPLGSVALQELKSAYLALNDATLLPGILVQLDERFGGQQRGAGLASETVAGEDDEPIELQGAGSGDSAERNGHAMNGARLTRPAVSETDTEHEPGGRRTPPTKDRPQRSEATAAPLASKFTATALQPPQQDRLAADRSAERLRQSNSSGAYPANGSAGHALMTESSLRTERHDESPLQQRTQLAPPVHVESALASRPPEHRTVSQAELMGARYVETFGGLHLFALADGRVFVDRHEALGSLEQARSYVDGLKPAHSET